MVDRSRTIPPPSGLRTAWFGIVSPSFYGEGCDPVPSAPTPAVTFDWTYFTALFPEFSCLNETQGQAYFDMAGIYVANVPTNPANCVGILKQLLMLVTAHIAWLLCPKDSSGNPSATGTNNTGGLVGRISSAHQGSVSVSMTLDGEPGSPSMTFYAQTKYGLLAWQAMAQFRTARWTVSPTLAAMVPGWLPGGFWGGVGGAGWGNAQA